MKFIPVKIRNFKASQKAIVDDCFYEEMSKYTWYLRSSSSYAGFALNVKGKKKDFLMHIMIKGRAPKGQTIDHINCDKLDNRLSNLRYCTIAENMCNRQKQRNNTSGYKCVYLVNKNSQRPWTARIKKNYKKYELGRFETPELAYEAYKVAAIKLHGEFARF